MPNNFSPNTLPGPVKEAFQFGALAWTLAVQRAIELGINDSNRLADIAFHMHHPERGGRPLSAGETKLIEQWKSFRNLIEPMIKFRPKPGTKPAAAPGTATQTREDELAAARAQLEQMRLSGKITNAEAHWADAAAMKVIGGLDQGVSYAGALLEFAEIAVGLDLAAGSATTAGATGAGFAFGVMNLAAPFLMFGGFMVALSDAMDTDLRIYRAVAMAYATTGWAFGETQSSSPMLRKRLSDPGSRIYGKPRSTGELDLNWSSAWLKVQVDLEMRVKRMGTPNAGKYMRMLMKSHGKINLAKGTMLHIADRLPRSREKESNSLRLLADELKYPG
jgi:hypothetical protein